MLKIDDQNFTQEQIDLALEDLAIWSAAREFPVTRLAVCTTSVFEWLLLVFYCRRHDISLAPVHAETPYAAACARAQTMQCDALWWHGREGLQAIAAQPLLSQSVLSEHSEKLAPARMATGALIQMSSGTTGAPKVVERSWQAIGTEIESYNQALGLAAQVTPVIACSVTHSYGLICGVLATLARGGMPHIISSWNPKYVWRILGQYQEPILYSAPAFIFSLMQLLPKEKLQEPYALYAVMTSGMVLPDVWFNEIKRHVRFFYQQYGCSEVGCISIAKNPQTANIIGRGLPHLQLSLNTGAASDQSAMSDQSAANDQSAAAPAELVVEFAQQRVHTRDLLRRNSQGEWIFCSRLDDTIIVAGINVYPVEVENTLLQLPGLREVVVFKKQNDLVGQRVAAIYTSEEEIPLPELRKFCAQYLARHQWPTHWCRVAEIPRLPGGKISRRALAEQDFSQRKKPEVA